MLTCFDRESRGYGTIPVTEQVEVASMLGDVALDADGEVALHVHLVLGRRDGTALAKHLDSAHARPTLEVVVTESPVHLRKQQDPESGLSLIRGPDGVRADRMTLAAVGAIAGTTGGGAG